MNINVFKAVKEKKIKLIEKMINHNIEIYNKVETEGFSFNAYWHKEYELYPMDINLLRKKNIDKDLLEKYICMEEKFRTCLENELKTLEEIKDKEIKKTESKELK